MRLELEKRSEHSTFYSIASPFIAIGLTLVFGAILFAVIGEDPAEALYIYFVSPLTSTWSLHELAVKSAPLILIGAGLSLCFLSSNWNIGAEGQFVMGAVVGSMMPIVFPDVQNSLVLPLMIIMGMAGGAAYAFIPAFLKTRFGTNEILTSLMLVYVAQLFLDWLVRGPWRNPEGFNFPESRAFHEYAILPEVLESGRAHYGAVFAILAVLGLAILLSKTLKGFEIQVTGQAPRAGRFGGFSTAKMTFFAFLLSGALAGLAGVSEVSGAVQQLRPVVSPGYGFTAIIVAFLGRLNPIGVLFAGILLGISYLGGEEAQIVLGLSDKITRVFQGMLLFFVLACDTLILYRIRLVSKRAPSLAMGEN
ncbi:ABC transporter permease [Rhizobiales bacterium]|uniref:ABC transporter permease n=1 Tax=Hongsoonwoonella zoysiae TaxID=2821844 RepID=UPI00156186A0|nr:ABC transporter permease [Hongsoonwoonella zoysiae]NRG18812.1 ABC transporter permease [Hongsoonwoonella zoysiae]